MEKKKEAPLGIKILAALYFISLAFYLFGLAVLIPRLGFLFSYNPMVALLIVITTIIMIALAGMWYGLLKLNPTAWRVAMVLYGVGLIINLLSLNVIAVIVGIIILWYLYSKKELYLGPSEVAGGTPAALQTQEEQGSQTPEEQG